ncbi:MAG: salicylate hydroxylase [Rhodospirillaceae bacterium]|nr:salicylate hydroxylase [Rhodospirillaceae bacterium]|tara:strand:- start:6277 stop:7500 length:1224 start_codon:yes stop_codon:yes gene_type:complete
MAEASLTWPAGNDRVPYWIYTDQGNYERELEKIFYGPVWNYVGLECEIPNPGDFKRTQIGDQSIIVVRDQEDGVNVLVNRCAHRGVKICEQDKGSFNEIMCPYHQWTYDLKGNLLGVPFYRGVKGKGGMPKDFSMGENGLDKVKVHVRNGGIWATMSDETPSFEDYMGERILGYYDREFDGRTLKLLGHSRQRIGANWKLMLENIKDTHHASLLHVFFVTFGLFRVDNDSKVEMDGTGLHTALSSIRGKQELNDGTKQMRSFHSGLELKDPNLLDVVREFPGDRTVVMQTIWPNVILQQQSNTLATRQIVPMGPNAFELHWTFFGYEDDDEEMTARRLRQANLMGPSGLVSIDDGQILERTQEGILAHPNAEGVVELGGRDTEDSDHMVTEVALRAFYKGYRNVMGI